MEFALRKPNHRYRNRWSDLLSSPPVPGWGLAFADGQIGRRQLNTVSMSRWARSSHDPSRCRRHHDDGSSFELWCSDSLVAQPSRSFLRKDFTHPTILTKNCLS